MEHGLHLGTIAEERHRKLQSVLTDRTDFEQSSLLDAVAGDPQLAGFEQELLPTLEYIRAQDYGPRDLDQHYEAHPIRVARFLTDWSANRAEDLGADHRMEIIQAGLVHNAIEKKILRRAESETRFGVWVADAVETITVDRAAMATRPGVEEYYRTLEASDAGVRALKLFDKFDNLLVICVHPDEAVRLAYIREIEEFLLPIIATTAPEIVAYSTGLIEDARNLGYYRPEPDEL